MLRRVLYYGGLTLAAIFVVTLGVVGIYVWSLSRGLPSVDQLKDYKPPVTTRVYASNGDLLGEYARERRFFVPIAFVPKLVIDAFTSAEDKNFFHHPGVDPSGILRAAAKDV